MKKKFNPYSGNPLLAGRPNRALSREEVHERFTALFHHYGISDPEHDPQAMAKLAYCLAKTHVPGFQPTLRAGRPKERTPFDLALFFMEFCRMQSENGNAPELTTLKQMSDDPWWVRTGFDSSKRDVLQAMRNAMRELRKPEIREQVESEIDTLVELNLERLKKSPKAQLDLREAMGEDSPAWRRVEALLRS